MDKDLAAIMGATYSPLERGRIDLDHIMAARTDREREAALVVLRALASIDKETGAALAERLIGAVVG